MNEPIECIAVGCAFFDPKLGSKLEWATNLSDSKLFDLEYLVLGPNFQHSAHEYICSRHPHFDSIWICCAFNSFHTDNSEERYSRMRTVFILTKNYCCGVIIAPMLGFLAYICNTISSPNPILIESSNMLLASDCTPHQLIHYITTSNLYGNCFQNTWDTIFPYNPRFLLDSCFLPIWQLMLFPMRILFYSKYNVTAMYYYSMDLYQSLIQLNTNHYDHTCVWLGYRTSAYNIVDSSNTTDNTDNNSNWIVYTSDIALVDSTMAYPWDILILCDDPIEWEMKDSIQVHIPKASFYVHIKNNVFQKYKQLFQDYKGHELQYAQLQHWYVCSMQSKHKLTNSIARHVDDDVVVTVANKSTVLSIWLHTVLIELWALVLINASKGGGGGGGGNDVNIHDNNNVSTSLHI